ncbi:MAG: 16S rRNA (guanine(527)-N(7))-methyltransferase RsmG [Bacteroidales bacterium]|nr:16S rRNA (guanine(527)-N(7))-methyltransferase RsmG [Bacteroidales bacterium]
MEIILKYFKNLSAQQIEQLKKLGDLYVYWNERVNVISRKDIDNLYERHILHSLSIAKYFNFSRSQKILDIGTGGGLPGIPLAIVFPEAEFLLVDSVGKKINIVNIIIEELKLKNIKAEKIRMEELNGKFDYAVCRAVSEIPVLIKWTKNKANNLICFKGGDLKEELMNVKEQNKIYELKGLFEEEFFRTKKIVHLILHK